MTHKPGSPKNRGGYLCNPMVNREGELIGGGFFVFRRGDGSNRIRPSLYPFEHPSLESAQKECDRLSALTPDENFIVVGEYNEDQTLNWNYDRMIFADQSNELIGPFH